MRALVLMSRNEMCQLNFDEYGLMLYYSKKINEAKATILYKSTATEYFYKLLRGIPVGNLTSEDEKVACSFQEMSQTINFIDTEVIPSLLMENKGIMLKYGGAKNFDILFRNEIGFTEDIFLDNDYQEDDSDAYSKDSIIGCFEYLRDFIQYALNNNSIYNVSINF